MLDEVYSHVTDEHTQQVMAKMGLGCSTPEEPGPVEHNERVEAASKEAASKEAAGGASAKADLSSKARQKPRQLRVIEGGRKR